jgi:hypothetical protein
VLLLAQYDEGMNTHTIERAEWRRVFWFAVGIIALTMLPYVAGALSQTAEMRFSGGVLGVEDFQSYIGKMRLGAQGSLDFYLFYTPEAHDSESLFFLPYLLPGFLVGRFIPADDPALTPALVITFHLLRLVFNALLIAILYRFIAAFLRAPAARMTALVLATLGGGFGWLLVLLGAGDWLGSLPPDFYIPEGFSFIVLLSLPHIALARAALLAGLLALFRALAAKQNWLRWALLAGICWLIVGLAVPFYLAILYAVLAAWAVALWLRERRLPLHFALRAGIAAGITLPLFAYYALVFARNTVFATWSAQNLLPSPHPLQYLLAYSLFIALAWQAGRWAWRRAQRSPRYVLLLAWVVIVPVLVYLPINVQRRTAEAVLVPLAILAAHGLAVLLRRLRRRQRPLARRLIMIVACLTSVFLLLTTLLGAVVRQPPVYIAEAQLTAFQWLAQEADTNAVVLLAMETGNILPAYTDLRPYVGHGPETLAAVEKQATAAAFFRGELDAAARAQLYEQFNIRYVFFGVNEQALLRESGAAGLTWAEELTLIYEQGGYAIFRVP